MENLAKNSAEYSADQDEYQQDAYRFSHPDFSSLSLRNCPIWTQRTLSKALRDVNKMHATPEQPFGRMTLRTSGGDNLSVLKKLDVIACRPIFL
jgi:hypothetical protein